MGARQRSTIADRCPKPGACPRPREGTRWPAAGFTIVEVIAAVSLVGVAIVFVGTSRNRLRSALREEALFRRIAWAQCNLKQQVRGWDPEVIAKERIETIPVDNGLNELIPGARWEVEVARIDQPVRAIQITATLAGNYRGQPMRGHSWTFWIDAATEAGEP